jgi:hypothetical protein
VPARQLGCTRALSGPGALVGVNAEIVVLL